jgi:hypothetical protein
MSHRFSLFRKHVIYRRVDYLLRPEVPRASMARPAETAPARRGMNVQGSTGIALEGVHDEFSCVVGANDYVHMSLSNVNREKAPAFMPAHFVDRL